MLLAGLPSFVTSRQICSMTNSPNCLGKILWALCWSFPKHKVCSITNIFYPIRFAPFTPFIPTITLTACSINGCASCEFSSSKSQPSIFHPPLPSNLNVRKPHRLRRSNTVHDTKTSRLGLLNVIRGLLCLIIVRQFVVVRNFVSHACW